MSDNLTIGILAERGGVNVETIRYYQRRGLLHEPLKPSGGFRRYPQESVKRVRFIKRAQNLGFTLEEILGLLALDERKACQSSYQRIEVRSVENLSVSAVGHKSDSPNSTASKALTLTFLIWLSYFRVPDVGLASRLGTVVASK